MAGKVGHINIFKYEFTFVFRHRYEKKKDEDDVFDRLMTWREWELGFWYKNFQVVGRKEFSNTKKWNENLVREHMLGINLIWCKAWVTVSKGAMNLGDD